MEIGNLQVESILDGTGRAPVEVVWRSAIEGLDLKGTLTAEWADHRQFLDADGFTLFPAGGFLVRSGEHLVLVDTGKGPLDEEEPPPGEPWPKKVLWKTGRFLEALAEVGVDPNEITDVVFSHLHNDHVGWASHDGRPTFPNATYRCHRADWDHFVAEGGPRPDPRILKSMTPVTERMAFWDQDGPILPGVDAMLAPGHTPGSTVIVLSSGGARALVLGDAVHCPVQLLESEWAAVGDLDPVLARKTRARLAEELEDGSTTASAPHFPDLAFGRVVATEVSRRWVV